MIEITINTKQQSIQVQSAIDVATIALTDYNKFSGKEEGIIETVMGWAEKNLEMAKAEHLDVFEREKYINKAIAYANVLEILIQ